MRFFLFFCFTAVLSFISAAKAGEIQALNSNTTGPTHTLESVNGDLSNSEISKYETLNLFFENGTLPTKAEVTGWWSGRCYGKESQNSPVGMLLLALSVTIPPSSNDNNGPLFPPAVPTKSFNIVLANINQFGDTPDRYDNLTPDDKRRFENFIESDFKFYISTTAEGSLSSRNESGNLKYLVRKYQNYFITKVVFLRDQDTFKSGDIFASCYFFKKQN